MGILLSSQSKNTIGNIFDKIKKLEILVSDLEAKSITDNLDINRAVLNKANVDLIAAYKIEKAFQSRNQALSGLLREKPTQNFSIQLLKERKEDRPL